MRFGGSREGVQNLIFSALPRQNPRCVRLPPANIRHHHQVSLAARSGGDDFEVIRFSSDISPITCSFTRKGKNQHYLAILGRLCYRFQIQTSFNIVKHLMSNWMKMAKKSTKSEDGKKPALKPSIITGVRLPVEVRSALDAAASEDGRTTSSLIQKILSDWLKGKKK
jgi:hypothetical protein